VREETRRLFPGLARFAAQAGFRSVMLLPGPIHSDLGRQRSLDLAVEGLTPLAEIAARNGVRLHLEADCDSCAHAPEGAEELCDRVPGIALTLDYSHFIFQGHAQREVERLHRLAGHLHVRQAAPGRIVESVAHGTIDYDRMLRGLKAAGYKGFFTVEYLHLEELDGWGIDVVEETRRMICVLDRLLAPEKDR
jgi:sugar phosphate isomerase/epimerase